MGKKKTHDEYVEEVRKVNPNISVLDKYEGSHIKISHLCNICNHEWNARPINILNGTGCPKCYSINRGDKRRSSHEEYVYKVKINNPSVTIIGTYTNMRTKILCKCNFCHNEWETIPYNILKGHGCPKCANEKISNRQVKSQDQYILEVNRINPDIEVLGTYISAKTRILHKCKICNLKWKTSPGSILSGSGCPDCANKKIGEKSKKTHIEYKEEIREINLNIEVLGKYIGAKIKIRHKCLICNTTWDTMPTTILNGCGCPECGKNRKSHENFIKELNYKNPNVEILGEYELADKKIKAKCKLCGNIWYPTPSSLLCGSGCRVCSDKNKTISKEEFEKRIKEKGVDIVILSNYVNTTTKITARCNICDNIWNVKPEQLLRGFNCPECNRLRQTKTNEKYIEELNSMDLKIIPLEKYSTAKTPIIHKCLECNYEWNSIPTNILKNHGCPKCADRRSGEIRRKSNDEYISELKAINPDIEVIDQYMGANTKIYHKCKLCDFEWEVTPSHILKGRNCPKCTSSIGEKNISKFLNEHNIKYEYEKTFDDLIGTGGRKLSYDFYISDLNLLIEYQGIQHYEPVDHFGGKSKLKIQQEHDKLKRSYAKSINIELLEIKYNENLIEILNNYFNNLNSESRETVVSTIAI